MISISEKIKQKFDFIRKLNDLFDQKERMQFIGVMVVALAMAIFQAIGVASILPFINMVVDPSVITENQWMVYFFKLFGFRTINSFMVASGFAVLGVLVVGNFISAFSTWLKLRFVWKKNHNLSCALLRKYIFMPYGYFLNQNTASLSKNVLSEVQQLTGNFLLPLIKIVTEGIMTVVIFVMLLYVNFLVTIVAAGVFTVLYFLIYVYMSGRLKGAGEKRVREYTGMYKSAGETLGGVKDIKVLGVEKFFLQRFFKHSSDFSDLQSWYQVVGQVPRYAMEMIAFGGIVSLLIFFVHSNMQTEKIIPLISFFAFAGYRIMPALQEIFVSSTVIRFNSAVLNRIHQDMSEGGSIERDNFHFHKKIKPQSFEKNIKLKNVYFTYPGNSNKALSNISLGIEKDSFVALVGSTGSGKTTLVDLLLGLFSPDNGSFQVDDIEIDQDNVKNWRANLGYVPQQIYLSDDTIARNIAFGLPDEEINMDQVEKAAQLANLHDFISTELPKSYQTSIGEKGVRLSGGQRQRIGIARALYHNPQVLIFDEATSSLDNKTEREVLKAIESVAKHKTMIVIAHRLTTVKNADVVYLIGKGKIVDKGSYEKIISKSGLS